MPGDGPPCTREYESPNPAPPTPAAIATIVHSNHGDENTPIPTSGRIPAKGVITQCTAHADTAHAASVLRRWDASSVDASA